MKMNYNDIFFDRIHKIEKFLDAVFNKEFTISYIYTVTSLLFFFGSFCYNQNDIYSDIFTIIIIQLFIYSCIINSILYTYVYLFSKKQVIISNLHILFSIFYNMVFQIMLNFNQVNINYKLTISLAVSFLFLLFITVITPKKRFCETVWLIAIYFTFFSYFENLGTIKYFTFVFLIYAFVVISFKIQDFFFEKRHLLIAYYFPNFNNIVKDVNTPVGKYVTISMIFWCSSYEFLNQRVNLLGRVLTFSLLGFWIPLSIMFLNNFIGNVFIPVCYFYFNIFLYLAKLHAEKVSENLQLLNLLDKNYEILKKENFVFSGRVQTVWKTFTRVAKESASSLGTPQGPNKWVTTTGGLLGGSATVYYAHRNIKSVEESTAEQKKANDLQEKALEEQKISNAAQEKLLEEQKKANAEQKRANDIQEKALAEQKRANDIQEKALAEQKRANDIQEKVLAEQNKSNVLLSDSNKFNERSAIAAEKYNAGSFDGEN